MKPFAQLVGKTMQVVISYACSSSYYLPNGLLKLTTRLSIGLVVSFVWEAVNTTPLDEVIGDVLKGMHPGQFHMRQMGYAAGIPGADLIAGSLKMGIISLASNGWGSLLIAEVLHMIQKAPQKVSHSMKQGMLQNTSFLFGDSYEGVLLCHNVARCARFSPDGRYLASASVDTSIKLFEVNLSSDDVKLSSIQLLTHILEIRNIPEVTRLKNAVFWSLSGLVTNFDTISDESCSVTKGGFSCSDKERNDAELKSHEFQGMVLHRDGNIKLFMREFERVSKERGELQKQVLSLEHEVVRGCRGTR
ncbi:cleavage stimulation factor subunit 50 isoform X3 [Tanacetum coccineum]